MLRRPLLLLVQCSHSSYHVSGAVTNPAVPALLHASSSQWSSSRSFAGDGNGSSSSNTSSSSGPSTGHADSSSSVSISQTSPPDSSSSSSSSSSGESLDGAGGASAAVADSSSAAASSTTSLQRSSGTATVNRSHDESTTALDSTPAGTPDDAAVRQLNDISESLHDAAASLHGADGLSALRSRLSAGSDTQGPTVTTIAEHAAAAAAEAAAAAAATAEADALALEVRKNNALTAQDAVEQRLSLIRRQLGRWSRPDRNRSGYLQSGPFPARISELGGEPEASRGQRQTPKATEDAGSHPERSDSAVLESNSDSVQSSSSSSSTGSGDAVGVAGPVALAGSDDIIATHLRVRLRAQDDSERATLRAREPTLLERRRHGSGMTGSGGGLEKSALADAETALAAAARFGGGGLGGSNSADAYDVVGVKLDMKAERVMARFVGHLTKSGHKARARRILMDAMELMRQTISAGKLDEVK